MTDSSYMGSHSYRDFKTFAVLLIVPQVILIDVPIMVTGVKHAKDKD